MIKSVKTQNEEIPEKLYLHPIYNVECEYVRLVDEKQRQLSCGFEFSMFLLFFCFIFLLSKFVFVFFRSQQFLEIAFFLQHTMTNRSIGTRAFQAVVVSLDDFPDFEASAVEIAALLLV